MALDILRNAWLTIVMNDAPRPTRILLGGSTQGHIELSRHLALEAWLIFSNPVDDRQFVLDLKNVVSCGMPSCRSMAFLFSSKIGP